MGLKISFKKALGLLTLALAVIPVMNVNALENVVEYKVYDSNNNYEFSCMVMEEHGMPSDHTDYSIRSCIANEKGINDNRITIHKNKKDVFYNIEYGSGTLKWSGEINTDWYDENSSIYFIKNEKELAGLAYLVNTGNTFKDKTVKLASDIDLSGHSWVPIGKNSSYAFEGVFDGQGFSIKNLNFGIYDDIEYYGLFGYVSSSTIQNLTVNLTLDMSNEKENIDEFYIAGISGYSSNSTFDSLVAAGTMNVNIDNANVGGIVGGGGINIQNSQSYVNITSSAYNIAGIAANVQYISVMNCVNFGNLHSTSNGKGGRVSGITAWAYGGTFQYTINYGTITSNNNDILKSSIIGFSGANGETCNHVYSQDNINIVSGKTGVKSEEITSDNLEEVLAILNQNDNWQIVDGKIVNVLPDIKAYTITVYSDNNGEIYYSSSDDNIINIKVIPNNGYELSSLEVYDSNNQKIELNGSEFIMPDSNVTINATFKPINYQFTGGEDATYQDTDLVFTLDGEYELVDKVLVNGNELDPSNYMITEGSTVLTLKDEYLKTLDAGTYELTVTYTNGSSDTTTFKINEKEEVTNPVENNQDMNKEDTVNNPKTFDGILFYVGLGLISIVGLTGAGIYFKKYAHNKTR